MTLERTLDGLEARLRPSGFGRFFAAGFLMVWLVGWAAGETFVLWFLGKGLVALLTGRPPEPGREPLVLSASLAVGLFLLVWLAIWTLGGVLAIRELLRLTSSEDRILARPDGLEIRRRLGPFTSTKRIPRDELLTIDAPPGQSRVLVERSRGIDELTRLGSREDRELLARAFRAEYGIDERVAASSDSAALPKGWDETVDPEGNPVLVSDLRARRVRSRIAWMATALVSGIAVSLLRNLQDHPELGALAAMFAAAAGMIAWMAYRLTANRIEWRLGSGRLTLRRREARGARDLFEATSLELLEVSDSDGDTWHTLNGIAAGEVPSDRRTGRRQIVKTLGDSATPRRLGQWIAERTGLPLDDRANPERRRQEMAEAIARLEASGRLGRWLASHIPRT